MSVASKRQQMLSRIVAALALLYCNPVLAQDAASVRLPAVSPVQVAVVKGLDSAPGSTRVGTSRTVAKLDSDNRSNAPAPAASVILRASALSRQPIDFSASTDAFAQAQCELDLENDWMVTASSSSSRTSAKACDASATNRRVAGR